MATEFDPHSLSDPKVIHWTASEIIARFGDLPVARVVTAPWPGHATEADVVNFNDHQDRLCELIDGVLLQKTWGLRESALTVWILTLLGNYVRPRKLGILLGVDGMFRIAPGQIRIPDASFISRKNLVGHALKNHDFWEWGCDLAIEVISTDNTLREMERKLADYFAAGFRLVWYVYPETREVVVYTSPSDAIIRKEGEMLDGGDVLPGFSVPVADIFAEMD